MLILMRAFLENAEKMMSLLQIKIEMSTLRDENRCFPLILENCSIFVHFLKISI